MSPAARMVLVRFVKGIVAAAVAAAVSYALGHVAELEGVVPAVVVAALTGGLLAVQKFLKEKGVPMP